MCTPEAVFNKNNNKQSKHDIISLIRIWILKNKK